MIYCSITVPKIRLFLSNDIFLNILITSLHVQFSNVMPLLLSGSLRGLFSYRLG